MQADKKEAEQVITDWAALTNDSKEPILMSFANKLIDHRSGILVWYDHHISTAKMEEINNRIKTIRQFGIIK